MGILRTVLFGSALASLSCASIIPTSERREENLAPLFEATGNDTKPGEYIVTLDDDTSYARHFQTIGRDLEADNSTQFTWYQIANSYHVTNLTSDWVTKIRRDAGVESVDEVEYFSMNDTPAQPANVSQYPYSKRSMVRARSTVWFPDDTVVAPWHLQVLSSGSKIDNPTDFKGPANQIKYNGKVGGGQGVNIYVIDSGVNINHVRFQGRARNFDKTYACDDGDCFQDFIGHGTAVAGLAAGERFGTAQGATIVNVKAFFKNGRGSPTTDSTYLLNALRDISTEHLANAVNRPENFTGSVINMSLGRNGRTPNPIRRAINSLYYAGVTVVTAAGNERESGVSADNVWPCNLNTICVGGISRDYVQDWYSNTGSNVTVFAPGSEIITLDYKTNNGVVYKYGTSMAAPLVSGIVATFVGWENLGNADVDDVNIARARLSANMLTNILGDKDGLSDLGGSQNNLATNGINYPNKANPADPYNGIGQVIESITYTNYNPFGMATVSGEISLYGLAATVTSEGATTTDTDTSSVSVNSAASTSLEDDDIVYASGASSYPSSTTAASAVAASTTASAAPSTTLPDEYTPTGSGTFGDGCIYVSCPSPYFCNDLGNCVIL